MNCISIEFISVLGMPPVEFVNLAADLGCGAVGMALAPFTANPHGYTPWSLRDDAQLRNNLKRALAATGVRISLGEGYLVRPGADIADTATDMDLMAELGVDSVNILSIDGDAARVTDQLGTFAEMAAARGMGATLEYMAGMPIGTLATALDAVRQLNQPQFTVLIDAMHFARSGSIPAELAAADPSLIGYLQLCDCPLAPPTDNYGEEAKHNRMGLGTGELPLAAIVAACPKDIPIGIEAPMLARAEAGEGPKDRLAASVAYAKTLIA